MPAIFSTKKIYAAAKILIPFGLAVFLFWYLYKDGFSDTLLRMKEVKYEWVFLSICFGVISHILRAYRWKLLLEATGHNPTLSRSLAALFIGYLVNLAVPRLGEVSRCLVLKRTDRIPVTSSLGTVVSERVLDVLSLLIIIGLTLLIEFDKLHDFFNDLFQSKLSGVFAGIQQNMWYMVIVGAILIAAWLFARKQIVKSSRWQKIRTLGKQMLIGLMSVTKLENKTGFWVSTAAIWFMYFLMSLVVFYSMEPTEHLGWQAGMALLVMGGIAMSAPVQGGIGAYHLLVSGLLLYYGVGKEEGLSFAFLLHSSQIVLIILAGLGSGLFILLLGRKSTVPTD